VTPLFGQLHLVQERVVAGVIGQVLEQRLANDFDETSVFLLVRTFEPLKCKIVIVPVGIVHGHVIGVAVRILCGERFRLHLQCASKSAPGDCGHTGQLSEQGFRL
jgi:hypothetical protein